MAKSKEMSMEEFFQDTFSEEFLREAEVEYTLAQIAGRAFDAKIEQFVDFWGKELRRRGWVVDDEKQLEQEGDDDE